MSRDGGEGGGLVNEQAIMKLSDILALQSVKATYCETVDDCARNARDAAARFNELFTEDVRADYGMGALDGRNAVVEFLVGAIGAINECLWHSIHTPRIEVTGDAAVGRWTIMARLKRKGSTVPDTLYGRYQDEFRRTPQGWRISSVRFIQES
jgi:ketosteroid isomerase-like protein